MTRKYKQFLEDGIQARVEEMTDTPTEYLTIGTKFRYILKLERRGVSRVVDLACDAESFLELLALRRQLFPGWRLSDMRGGDTGF